VEDLEITEIVLVAIIAASSALLGATITGIITYKVTKQQSNVQMNLHRESLQQQTNEARRDRLVQARDPLLLEIRDAASKTFAAYSDFVNAIQLTSTYPTEALTELERHIENWRKEQSRLSELAPQISDEPLNTHLNTFRSVFLSAMPTTDNPIKASFERGLDDHPFEHAPAALASAQQHLFNVNKRIEELLAGDDPT